MKKNMTNLKPIEYKITIYLKKRKKYVIYVDSKNKFDELYNELMKGYELIKFYSLIINVKDFKLAELEII